MALAARTRTRATKAIERKNRLVTVGPGDGQGLDFFTAFMEAINKETKKEGTDLIQNIMGKEGLLFFDKQKGNGKSN